MKHKHLHETCRQGNYPHFRFVWLSLQHSCNVAAGGKGDAERVVDLSGLHFTISLSTKLAGGSKGWGGPWRRRRTTHILVVCRAGSICGRRLFSGELASNRCTTKPPCRHSDSISDLCYGSTAESSRLYYHQLLLPPLSVTSESTPDFISLS